jgi:nuclear protein localization family protein 4
MAAQPYVERLSDFHLLLWLAKQPNLDPNDMALLCEAVRGHRPVLEGYRVIIDSIAGIAQ